MAVEKKYSLWLIPEGRLYEQLHSLIQQLGKPHMTPEFEPHVTLIGGIKTDVETLVLKTGQLASSTSPYQITLDKIDFHDTFYQCLFAHVVHTPEVMKAHAEAQKVFDRGKSNDYIPHLSLMYGTLKTTVKQRVIMTIGDTIQGRFWANSIHLFSTTGPPEQWFRIARFMFRDLCGV